MVDELREPPDDEQMAERLLSDFATWLGDPNRENETPAAVEDQPTEAFDTDTSSSIVQLQPGSLVGGRYEVGQCLGSGGFGQVYQATDTKIGRDVAIKISSYQQLDSPAARDRYLREANALGRIDHPNVVRVYDCGESDDEGICWVTAEVVSGGDLLRLMRRGPLSWQESTELVASVADALQAMHERGLVHRDVKPANILLDDQDQPKLVDFGLALRDEEVHLRPSFAGTCRYMSPEQLELKASAVDGRTDVYSLAVVLYQLLTGRLPYLAEDSNELQQQIRELPPKPLRQLDRTIPADLEQVCLQALAKRPEDRFTTAEDFAAALRACLKPPSRSFLSGRSKMAGGLLVVGLLAAITYQLVTGVADNDPLASTDVIPPAIPAVVGQMLYFPPTDQLDDSGQPLLSRTGMSLAHPLCEGKLPVGGAYLVSVDAPEQPMRFFALTLAADGQVFADSAQPTVATKQYLSPPQNHGTTYPFDPDDELVFYFLEEGAGMHGVIVLGFASQPPEIGELLAFAEQHWTRLPMTSGWRLARIDEQPRYLPLYDGRQRAARPASVTTPPDVFNKIGDKALALKPDYIEAWLVPITESE